MLAERHVGQIDDALFAYYAARRADLRLAAPPRRAGVLAFLPPIARLLSRLPRAPIRLLPSVSCCAVLPVASLRLVFARFCLFFDLLSFFEAPASCRAMAMACLRLFTLPPLPPEPLFNSP